MRTATNERSVRRSVLVGVGALLLLVPLLVFLDPRTKCTSPPTDAEQPVPEPVAAPKAVRESQRAGDTGGLPDTHATTITAAVPGVQRGSMVSALSPSNAIEALSPTNVSLPAGETNTDLVRLELVWIPPGTFMMGSPEGEPGRRPGEGPRTQVTLTRGFWMGKREVTIDQFFSLVDGLATPHRTLLMQELDPNLPIHNVSWLQAMVFCGRLTQHRQAADAVPAGYQYRLPTEAEWEYACRSGTATAFNFGSDAPTQLGWYAWYGERNLESKPQRVGLKRPNNWGLYDMHGNVGEWCLDWLGPGYPGGELVDPVGPLRAEGGDEPIRVGRGGSWRSPADGCRSAQRHWLLSEDLATGAIGDWGFRIVLGPVIEVPVGVGQ